MLPQPPDGFQDDAQADNLLNRFVFGKSFDSPTPLPKRVDPQKVNDFLSEVLESDDLAHPHLSRIGQLMRFYDIQSLTNQLPRFLDRNEGDKLALFDRSRTVVALLGDMGNEAEQAQASEYYRYLMTHILASDHFEHLIDLFFHLPEKAEPVWASDPIKREIKALEPKIQTDEDAEVHYYELQDILEDRLPTIQKAKKKKHDALNAKDANRQRQDYGHFYLELERTAYIDTPSWGVMMLQRECNASRPEELAEVFKHGLDLIMSRAKARRSLDAGDTDDLKTYVTRCARAIEFYGGTLSEDQAKYAEKYAHPEQNDVLYWEPEDAKTPAGSGS